MVFREQGSKTFMKIHCNYCGAYINIEQEMFCPNCGAELPVAQKACQSNSQHVSHLQESKRELQRELMECVKAYKEVLASYNQLNI